MIKNIRLKGVEKYIVITILIIMILLVGFLVKKNWKVNTEIEVVSTYNNPIILEGFQTIETESASWETKEGIPVGWNNGLVVEDKIGNQFVWIPVNLENEEYIQLSANDTWCFKKENMQKENKEDLQILKYGGFYIGRYEAGMLESLKNNNTNIGSEVNNIKEILVSKKDVLPWNFISWENAKSNSQNKQ